MYIVREVDPLATGNKEVVEVKDAMLEKKPQLSWDDIFDQMDRPDLLRKSNAFSTNAEEIIKSTVNKKITDDPAEKTPEKPKYNLAMGMEDIFGKNEEPINIIRAKHNTQNRQWYNNYVKKKAKTGLELEDTKITKFLDKEGSFVAQLTRGIYKRPIWEKQLVMDCRSNIMTEWHKIYPEHSRVLRLAKRVAKDRVNKGKNFQQETSRRNTCKSQEEKAPSIAVEKVEPKTTVSRTLAHKLVVQRMDKSKYSATGNPRINGDFYSKYMNHDYRRKQTEKQFIFDQSCHKDLPKKVRNFIHVKHFKNLGYDPMYRVKPVDQEEFDYDEGLIRDKEDIQRYRCMVTPSIQYKQPEPTNKYYEEKERQSLFKQKEIEHEAFRKNYDIYLKQLMEKPIDEVRLYKRLPITEQTLHSDIQRYRMYNELKEKKLLGMRDKHYAEKEKGSDTCAASVSHQLPFVSSDYTHKPPPVRRRYLGKPWGRGKWPVGGARGDTLPMLKNAKRVSFSQDCKKASIDDVKHAADVVRADIRAGRDSGANQKPPVPIVGERGAGSAVQATDIKSRHRSRRGQRRPKSASPLGRDKRNASTNRQPVQLAIVDDKNHDESGGQTETTSNQIFDEIMRIQQQRTSKKNNERLPHTTLDNASKDYITVLSQMNLNYIKKIENQCSEITKENQMNSENEKKTVLNPYIGSRPTTPVRLTRQPPCLDPRLTALRCLTDRDRDKALSGLGEVDLALGRTDKLVRLPAIRQDVTRFRKLKDRALMDDKSGMTRFMQDECKSKITPVNDQMELQKKVPKTTYKNTKALNKATFDRKQAKLSLLSEDEKIENKVKEVKKSKKKNTSSMKK